MDAFTQKTYRAYCAKSLQTSEQTTRESVTSEEIQVTFKNIVL